MANFSIPIQPVQTTSGNQWLQNRLYEDASQTFYAGTPVELYTTGGVKVWDGTTLTNGILGIAYEAASNLATLGGAATPYVQPLQPFSGPGATLTFGKVPNESSASNIPHGAPLNDGRVGFTLANADTIFSAAFRNICRRYGFQRGRIHSANYEYRHQLRNDARHQRLLVCR